ncbi:hypothetical protein HDU98_003356 [Podochytrium sp. JEL0797]|nr:hypothetical protein HDU98_003356 [Podochytrium sp. JEL0797]
MQFKQSLCLYAAITAAQAASLQNRESEMMTTTPAMLESGTPMPMPAGPTQAMQWANNVMMAISSKSADLSTASATQVQAWTAAFAVANPPMTEMMVMDVAEVGAELMKAAGMGSGAAFMAFENVAMASGAMKEGMAGAAKEGVMGGMPAAEAMKGEMASGAVKEGMVAGAMKEPMAGGAMKEGMAAGAMKGEMAGAMKEPMTSGTMKEGMAAVAMKEGVTGGMAAGAMNEGMASGVMSAMPMAGGMMNPNGMGGEQMPVMKDKAIMTSTMMSGGGGVLASLLGVAAVFMCL